MQENKKPENPSAFPCLDNNDYAGQIKVHSEGMTLRDYFAAKAMQGLISNMNVSRPHPENGELQPQYDSFTRIAYEYADAMLKQREL